MDLPTLPPGYLPSEDEEYMNPQHLAFFRLELERWKQDLLDQTVETLKALANESMQAAESTDRASFESNRALELRTRDRSRKLVIKIEQALRRIEQGVYGYCEETGDPIGLGRLRARPIATLSIEAQEAHERDERMSRP